MQLHGLALRQDIDRRGIFSDIERLTVGFNQPANIVRNRVWRGFECCQADAIFVGIQYTQGGIISPHQRQSTFEHGRRYFAKIGSRVQRISDFQQRVCRLGFAFLVVVDARVLIADGELRGDGNQEGNFLVGPMTCRARMMKANQTEHFIIEHNRHDQKRACAEAPRKESNLVIKIRRRRVIELDWLSDVEVLRESPNIDRNAHLHA